MLAGIAGHEVAVFLTLRSMPGGVISGTDIGQPGRREVFGNGPKVSGEGKAWQSGEEGSEGFHRGLRKRWKADALSLGLHSWSILKSAALSGTANSNSMAPLGLIATEEPAGAGKLEKSLRLVAFFQSIVSFTRPLA